jgi:protein-disulfide isomerase
LKFKTPLVALVALYFALGYAVGQYDDDESARSDTIKAKVENAPVAVTPAPVKKPAQSDAAPAQPAPAAQQKTVPIPVKAAPTRVAKSPTPVAASPTPTANKPTAAQVWKVAVNKEDATKGPASAPLTCVFFSAFGCPNCKVLSDAPEKLVKKYGKRVRVVFKHKVIPLSHPGSMDASIAALAAKEQGKFWQFHDKLFAQSQTLNAARYLTIAKELGLNLARFQKAIKSGGLRAQVLSDSLLANQVGAHSMPNILCNGVRMSGAKSYENLEALVDKEMPAAQSAIKGGIKTSQLYAKLTGAGKSFPQLGPQQFTFKTDKSPALGKKNARVEVVVFEDFQ